MGPDKLNILDSCVVCKASTVLYVRGVRKELIYLLQETIFHRNAQTAARQWLEQIVKIYVYDRSSQHQVLTQICWSYNLSF